MPTLKRYNAKTKEWETIAGGGGGGSVELANINKIGGEKALRASRLVSELCADEDFQDWCNMQVPPLDYSESRTWDQDFTSVLNVYSKFIQDATQSTGIWGTNLLDDISGTEQLYPLSSIGIASYNNYGVVKGAETYDPEVHNAPVAINPETGSMYSGGIQSDLDQNDDTKPDYVKNRKYGVPSYVPSFSDCCTYENRDFIYLPGRSKITRGWFITGDAKITINAGDELSITLSGLTINATAKYNEDTLYCGNLAILRSLYGYDYDEDYDNGENYCFMFWPNGNELELELLTFDEYAFPNEINSITITNITSDEQDTLFVESYWFSPITRFTTVFDWEFYSDNAEKPGHKFKMSYDGNEYIESELKEIPEEYRYLVDNWDYYLVFGNLAKLFGGDSGDIPVPYYEQYDTGEDYAGMFYWPDWYGMFYAFNDLAKDYSYDSECIDISIEESEVTQLDPKYINVTGEGGIGEILYDEGYMFDGDYYHLYNRPSYWNRDNFSAIAFYGYDTWGNLQDKPTESNPAPFKKLAFTGKYADIEDVPQIVTTVCTINRY